LSLSTRSHFTVAIVTVNRPVIAWFKGYFGVFATLSTYHREHLARGSIAVATTSIALSLPCLAAFGTTFGLVSITLGLEILLILSAVGELSPTIGTLE